MMRSTRRFSLAALMAVSLWVPNVARAEYGGYTGSSSAIGPIESVLRPAGAALGARGANGQTIDPLTAAVNSIDERLKQASATLERSKEERELRDKVSTWRDKIDQLKATRALPDLVVANAIKQREREAQEGQRFFQQLQSLTPPPMNPGDVNTSKLPADCRSGLDFQSLTSTSGQLKNLVSYVTSNGNDIMEQQQKEAKEQKIKNLQALAAHFDSIAQQDETQNEIQALAKGDVLAQDNSLKTSIAKLQGTLQQQKKDAGQLRRDLVKDVFAKFIPALAEIRSNDNRVQQLAAFFRDGVENFRVAMQTAVVQGAQQLQQNCQKIATKLGQDGPLSSSSWLNSAYQFAARANPQFANDQLLPMLNQIAQNAQCTDVTQQVAELFGSQIQAAEQQLSQTRDPKTLLQGAMTTLQALASAQSQVGAMLDPLMQDCQYAADQTRKMQNYVNAVKQQTEQQASGDGSAPRSTAGQGNRRFAGRRGTGTGTTHTGNQTARR